MIARQEAIFSGINTSKTPNDALATDVEGVRENMVAAPFPRG